MSLSQNQNPRARNPNDSIHIVAAEFAPSDVFAGTGLRLLSRGFDYQGARRGGEFDVFRVEAGQCYFQGELAVVFLELGQRP